MSVRLIVLKHLDREGEAYASSAYELVKQVVDDPTKQSLISAGAMTVESMVSEGLIQTERTLDDPNADPRARSRSRMTYCWTITRRGRDELANTTRAHSKA